MRNVDRWMAVRFAALGVCAALLAACSTPGALQSGASAQGVAPLPQVRHVDATAKQWFVKVGAARRRGVLEGLDFYWNNVTVDVGDSVTWRFAASAHTVSFLAPGQSITTASTKPAGGTTEDGTTFTSSGIEGPGGKYTLKFTKAGTYTYYCLLHAPEMTGTITVQPAGTKYPHTQGYYTRQGRADAFRDLSAAALSVKSFPYTNHGTTLVAGIAPGLAAGQPVQPTVYAFLDANRLDATDATVKVGTTVTWVNQANNEPHTVTFPVKGQPLPSSLVNDPFAPPSGGTSYDGTQVTNSGILMPGASYSLQFTKAGRYKYYCLLHFPFGMIGTIVVKK